MRLLKLSKWLVLGGGAAALLLGARRVAPRRAVRARDDRRRGLDDLRPDPRDPVQGFDTLPELGADPLAFDAMSMADVETAQDLAALETDIDDRARELDTPSQTELDAVDASFGGHDTGDLYGVHTPRATDRDIPDDRAAMDAGENWIEALQTSAVEGGVEVEHEVDVVDEVDEPPHPTDTRDIPVADRGSAGPGGV